MDLQKMIEELYAEKDRLEHVIASLELIQGTDARVPEGQRVQERRGRRSMGLEERQAVSQRMQKYWAGRRPNEEIPTD